MTQVQVGGVSDWAALGARWRDLEQRADPSFFQTWTWTGTLAAERFPDPVLVSATEDGRTVALALFNRVGRRLYLGEAGDAERDSPYIEHNGVLAEAGREDELTRACLRAAVRLGGLVLSGISVRVLEAVRAVAGQVWIAKASDTPFADLAALRRSGQDVLALCSANTRQQIRRSDRSYAGRGGLTFRRAASLAEAHAMLDRMAALHQAAWQARGRPGSFARPFFGRFHHALLDAGFSRGEVALTAGYAGEALIGVLYNLSARRRVFAYQSGFDYLTAAPHEKPGLTCHHAEIRLALAEGADVYDFLAGDHRYKRSLANGAARQFWVETGPLWSPRLLLRRMRGLAARRVGLIRERSG